MATVNVDTILSVEDFYRGDRGAAFDVAGDSPERAERDALIEVREALGYKRRPSRIVVESCEFEEFDSGNISHAGAHYNVVVGGLTDDEAAKLIAAGVAWVPEAEQPARKYLVAVFDVTGLNDAQIASLGMHVQAQAEASDQDYDAETSVGLENYPSVPVNIIESCGVLGVAPKGE